MKTAIPFLVFIVVFMFSSSVFAQSTITTNNNNNNVNTSNSSSTSNVVTDADTKTIVINPPPSAISPSINSNNMDLCTTGASTAVQTQILGLSKGTTVRDPNCERLKLSKTLYDMGMKVAAVSLMCQDKRVFDAMMNAGTPCPYDGLIGQEAKAAWKVNAGEAPLEEGEKEEKKEMDVDQKTLFAGVGLAGLLALLILL